MEDGSDQVNVVGINGRSVQEILTDVLENSSEITQLAILFIRKDGSCGCFATKMDAKENSLLCKLFEFVNHDLIQESLVNL